MKFYLKTQAVVIFAISVIGGCRKGANDPFISLRSRTSRLVGAWEIKEMKSSRYSESGIPGKTDYYRSEKYLNGRKFVQMFILNNDTQINNVYKATGNLTINHIGTIEYSETLIDKNGGSFTNVRSGNWQWANSSKKKSGVEIGDANGSALGQIFDGGIFEISRLSRDEVVIKFSDKTESRNNNTGEYSVAITSVYFKLNRVGD